MRVAVATAAPATQPLEQHSRSSYTAAPAPPEDPAGEWARLQGLWVGPNSLGSVVSIAVGDFDRDGMLDLAVSDARANTVTVLLGSGNGSFRPIWTFQLPMPGKVFHLAAADFNGDGLLDLAVTYEDDESFEVMIGNGNGTFTYAPALSHTRDPNSHCVT